MGALRSISACSAFRSTTLLVAESNAAGEPETLIVLRPLPQLFLRAFGLVLPQLTPASMVALWRRAGTDAVGTLGVQATAANVGVRPLAGLVAAASTAALAASAPALTDLRRWLASRFDWRPA